jgi:hypothetical protein
MKRLSRVSRSRDFTLIELMIAIPGLPGSTTFGLFMDQNLLKTTRTTAAETTEPTRIAMGIT